MDCLQAQDDEVSDVRICIRKKYDRIYYRIPCDRN